VIEFERDAAGRFSKLLTLARFAADRPLVWIDDELTEAARAWATGLAEELVAAIISFLDV
jgi:hypothetical protein